MGFDRAASDGGVVPGVLVAGVLGLVVPPLATTRGLLLSIIHYSFVIPSLIILMLSNVTVEYFVTLGIAYVAFAVASSLRLRVLVIARLPADTVLALGLSLILLILCLYVFFGGVSNFNLDLERVYEFRSESADALPSVFGYFYSNVAGVVVPFVLVFALLRGRLFLGLIIVVLAILLFGLTHHKSVFFAPLAVAVLYFTFRAVRSTWPLGALFVSITLVSIGEIVVVRSYFGDSFPGVFTSYFVRRSMLVPPLIDRAHIEFFSTNAFYFWSTSKLTFGALTSPSDVTAPFLIGREMFGDDTLAANTGIVGSGYANAGLIGVFIYSVVAGLMVSLLNAYGRRLGHGFVSAVSVLLVFTLVTSADLVTALLSHGIVLLFVLMASVAPSQLAKVERSCDGGGGAADLSGTSGGARGNGGLSCRTRLVGPYV